MVSLETGGPINPAGRQARRRRQENCPAARWHGSAHRRRAAAWRSARDTTALSAAEIRAAMGDRAGRRHRSADRAVGRRRCSQRLQAAGGHAYSNYAVGLQQRRSRAAATRLGIPVGNTPGVLTETTAEMAAVALTFAAARRAARNPSAFCAPARYHGWLPDLFLGELLGRRTVGHHRRRPRRRSPMPG
ncbi:MAG: hypothetical protein MZV70_20580 [Desulfobacterales bacterium]|nr:hypothetical protein [Desulfobacterales bacterium]